MNDKNKAMTQKQKLSATYRMLCALGFHYSEEKYGQVSIWTVVKQAFGNMHRKRLQNMLDWPIIEPFAPRNFRAKILRKIGCNVGKHVYIGDYVRVDLHYAKMIFIDDYAHLTAGCRLLCHQRDLTNYRVGDNASECGYKLGEIHIGKGVMIGQETMIMPGVTIGDGAIVGAGSLITKDIPPYCVAVGRPAKVIRQIEERTTNA